MKKRICIDLRICQKKARYTGVGVYAFNLCKTLLNFKDDYDFFFLVIKGYNLPFEINSDKLIYVYRLRKPESFQELFDFIDVKYLLKKNNIKVFHSLVPCVIKPSNNLKVIVTIHDIIPDIIKEEEIKSSIQKFIYKIKMHSASLASFLIFNSNTSKKDFLDYYTFKTLNYSTIYLGPQFEHKYDLIDLLYYEYFRL